VIPLELPETLEEIVVWKLENAQRVERYLYYLQMTSAEFQTARELVLEWLVRIARLGVVTSDQTFTGDLNDYYRVSVAGVLVCTVTHLERNEILGETRA
jgi:hypothetical protein